MRSNCLLALVALVLALVACAADGRDMKVGGWQPVGDLSDPHVVEIAKFALSEFSKQSEPVQNKLVYYNMAKGETMVESGVRYQLVIGATNETIPDPLFSLNYYEGVVLEKAWKHFRQLLSFAAIPKEGN